jgi:DNA-directed RNA polymerase specialized sigma24 family protein
MSLSPPSSQPASEPSARVPPLTSSTGKGEPYKRRTDIEAKIIQALDRPSAEWPAMADATGEGRLPDEALVFLIRAIQNGDRDLLGRLIYSISRRTAGIARHFAQGFDKDTTNGIIWNVEKEIIDLVLVEIPSRQSEFLEVAFRTAVERRTINIVAKQKQHPQPLRRAPAEPPEGEEEAERLTELVPDERPGPEEILAELEDRTRRPELIKRAMAAVKDPRHLEAVILRHAHGWPITDKDPTKPTLARHFGVSGRQIQNWITDALEAMRAAIGDIR